MKTIESKAFICLEKDKLIYNVCTLTQYQNGEYYWYSFKPNYEIIDLIDDFEGIQGLNLESKKPEFIREGLPVFLEERIVPKNRENLFKELEDIDIHYYDPLLIFVRDRRQYFGDRLFGMPYQDRLNVEVLDQSNEYTYIKKVLSNLVFGNKVFIKGREISLNSYFALYPIYLNLLKKKREEQQKGKQRRLALSSYRGRTPLPVNKKEFILIYQKVVNKEMRLEKALGILGMSRSTYFRKIKSIKNDG